jgi:porin
MLGLDTLIGGVRCSAAAVHFGKAWALGRGWGVYLTAERQLWSPKSVAGSSAEGLAGFLRVGGSPADRNPLEYYLEGGLAYRGMVPGRADDACGVAVVYGQMSHDARWLVEDCNHYSVKGNPLPDYELVIETTYQVVVRPGFTVQPVVGLLVHPAGAAGGDALVLGIRFNLDL